LTDFTLITLDPSLFRWLMPLRGRREASARVHECGWAGPWSCESVHRGGKAEDGLSIARE